jgi:hypothetical protein
MYAIPTMTARPKVVRALLLFFLTAALAWLAIMPSSSRGAAGVTWTSQVSAADNNWTSVAYGAGLFVAVSNDDRGTVGNRVMTSPDGVSWTAREAAANNDWKSVAHGNGTFVAVAESGDIGDRVMTSPNGVTWTARTAAAKNNWTSVAFGNGVFVAVSDPERGTVTDRVMTSTEGVTWTAQTAAANNNWTSVTYGDGTFVAVAADNAGTGRDTVMTSSDGAVWTIREAANRDWRSVTYGNGIFVAVASDAADITVAGAVMTSTDGVEWIPQTPSAANAWRAVTYGDGAFVAVASNSVDGTAGRVMASPDGAAWTSQDSPTRGWKAVTWGSGTFVAVSESGTGDRVMISVTPEPEPEPSPAPTPAPGPAPTPVPGPVPSPAPSPAPGPGPDTGVRIPASFVRSGLPVAPNGTVGLPLACPSGIPGGCDASGVLSTTLRGPVRADGRRREQASPTRVLARFRGIQIASGRQRLYSVRLDRPTYIALRRAGIRRVPATLRIINRLESGSPVVTRERVWLRILPLVVPVTG